MAGNVVSRQLEPVAADLTYLATGEGWLSLVAAEDLYSERIASRSMGSKADGRLVSTP